jgi:hypothetical protein
LESVFFALVLFSVGAVVELVAIRSFSVTTTYRSLIIMLLKDCSNLKAEYVRYLDFIHGNSLSFSCFWCWCWCGSLRHSNGLSCSPCKKMMKTPW